MLKNGRIKILLPLFSMIITTRFFGYDYVFALDALIPFPRQEITTGNHDGIQVNETTGLQKLADYVDLLDNSSDIQKITYSSDGKTVNATSWLGGPLHTTPSLFGANTVVYGVLVDVDNNPATGKFGVDYQKEIQWTNNTRIWNGFLLEYSSSEGFRVLNLQRNYTDFFENNQSFALVSLDLKSLTSPTVFRVMYHAIVIYDHSSKMLLDLSGWIDIPPPKYVFSTTPSILIFRQGEQRDIGVHLVSNTATSPKVVDYITYGNSSFIKLDFNPNELNQSQFTSAPAPFRITIPPNTPIGRYVLPILANVSTGSTFPSKFINLGNLTLPITTHDYYTAAANLTISVIQPPEISERVKEFWSVHGALISLIGAGFAGGVSTFLFDYLKSRRSKGEYNLKK